MPAPAAGLPHDGVSPPITPKSGQKRKIGDAILSELQPQQYRRCRRCRHLFSFTPDSSASSYLNLPPTCHVRAPEPGSINSIMREHSRTRLYVRPFLWTSQHLQLLECQFVFEKAPQQTETSGPEQGLSSDSANKDCCPKGEATGGQQYGEAANFPTEAAIRKAVNHLRRTATFEFKIMAIQYLLEDLEDLEDLGYHQRFW